jgi:hypothetical protein
MVGSCLLMAYLLQIQGVGKDCLKQEKEIHHYVDVLHMDRTSYGGGKCQKGQRASLGTLHYERNSRMIVCIGGLSVGTAAAEMSVAAEMLLCFPSRVLFV